MILADGSYWKDVETTLPTGKKLYLKARGHRNSIAWDWSKIHVSQMNVYGDISDVWDQTRFLKVGRCRFFPSTPEGLLKAYNHALTVDSGKYDLVYLEIGGYKNVMRECDSLCLSGLREWREIIVVSKSERTDIRQTEFMKEKVK